MGWQVTLDPASAADSSPTDVVCLTVDPSESGKRIDAYLSEQFPTFSRVQWSHAVQSHQVTVDGISRKSSYRLRGGEQLRIQLPEPRRQTPQPEPIALSVLYEDEHLAAINKPPGMVVHPARGHWSGTLASALAHHFQHLSQIGGGSRPGIVHRLDRDTSGVILVAKTDQVHLMLAEQFAEREVKKEYLAISRGHCDRDRDVIDVPIGPHPYQREKMAVRRDHPESRPATSFYEIAERYRGFVVFRVFPKTGRTHQIRVHLTHIGCPVVADPLYSGQNRLTAGELQGRVADQEVVIDRCALHAHRIAFEHPVTRQTLEIVAPVPDDLQHLLAQLQLHCSTGPPRRGDGRSHA